MADPLVRRDIWNLEDEQQFHPITVAYARAIDALQQRPADDQTSLEFQAAIHSNNGVTALSEQCQHHCWWFLSWHRAYLFWFEQIIRDALDDIPEVDDETKAAWALPYWNYGRGGKFATVPPALREPQLPDGSPNALLVDRDAGINSGDPIPDLDASAERARSQTHFAVPGGGFGGPPTPRNHFFDVPGAANGFLESRPHNSVHSDVGGLMGDFNTAGLDPLFWMHHCNIDRLWEAWRGEGNQNPDDSDWLDEEFEFFDPQRQSKMSRASGVLDTAGQLGYTYEDATFPDPTHPTPTVVPMALPPEHPPELVGASDEGLTLAGGDASVSFPLEEPKGPASGGAGGLPEHAFLDLEGIEGEANHATAYAVYVDGAPEGRGEEPHLVTSVSFFGIEQTSNLDADHPGGHSGARLRIDITGTVHDLEKAQRWGGQDITVRLSPTRPERESAGDEPPIHIGRVAVYYQ